MVVWEPAGRYLSSEGAITSQFFQPAPTVGLDVEDFHSGGPSTRRLSVAVTRDTVKP